MKGPRVLQLIASSRGGGAVHVRDLTFGLQAQGFSVCVAMPEDDGNVRRDELESQAVPFHRVDIAEGFSGRALWRIRELASGADLLHVHGARAALFGRLVAASLGQQRPRTLFTVHGFAAPHYPWIKRKALLLIERILARVTDAWICVSQAERDSLIASRAADPRRTTVIHNGIDVTRFAPLEEACQSARHTLGLDPTGYVVVTVCRLYRPRDLGTLLQAFRLSVDRGLRGQLLIVGEGPLRPDIERHVASLKLGGIVRLLGMRRDVPLLLSAADCFVLSSRGWEGLPLTVLEAMAAGLPVIASDVGGTKEAVVEGETGHLFAPGDFGALASRLQELAANRSRGHELGLAGRQRVERLFTADRMVRQTSVLYHAILSSPRTAPY